MAVRMKIFHVCPNFYPVRGGIETFVYELSKELAGRGHDVTVITGNKIPGRKVKLASYSVKDVIKIHRFNFKKVSRYNTSIDALKFIMGSEFDILHIHGIGFFSDAIPLIKASGYRKVVLSTHGGIFHTKTMLTIKNIYFKTMARIAGKFADAIIAVSRQDKKFMETVSDKEKIFLIGNGIEWKRLSRIKNSGDGRTLVYFGRLASSKRIDNLLRVVKSVQSKMKNVRIYVAGADWGEMNKLKKLATELGIKRNVTFTGEVSNNRLYNILSKSDAFLLASEYEGFGISVVEAMAAGLPVVVNNIETMKEIVTNGKNGYLVNYERPAAVAHVIVKLMKNKPLRRRIGIRARAYAKRLDWDVVAERIENVYKSLLEEK